MNAHFLTAIGHEVDKTLLQQVADKGFITPSALGQYSNSVYNDTIAEMQNSKAKLVDNITKQLKSNYEHQINNLKEVNANVLLAQQNRIAELQQISDEKVRLAKQSGRNTTLYWFLIIVAIIIGFVIGKLL